jgi:hypothetical protein
LNEVDAILKIVSPPEDPAGDMRELIARLIDHEFIPEFEARKAIIAVLSQTMPDKAVSEKMQVSTVTVWRARRKYYRR